MAAYYLLSVLMGAGAFVALGAALCGWEWFFRSASVRMLVGNMPRPAARALYGLIGVVILTVALFVAVTAPRP